MPQAIPAAVAWAAAAWSSAVAVTAAAVTAVTAGAIAGTAATAIASAGLQFVAMTALSAAAAAMMRPNVPSSGTTLDFKPDPKAPVRGMMGYGAIGGNKVFQATWGYNRTVMSMAVALSLGPIQGVTQFRSDDVPVTFAGSQQEAVGFYDKDMWLRHTTGLPTDTAILPPTGLPLGNPGLTAWGSQNAAPGVAMAFWTLALAKKQENRDIFTNGVPEPRWIVQGQKVWDPRRDSTYPGGNGPQRRDDWRTWVYSENPYAHALQWVRGHFKMNTDGSLDRTRRIAGIGAPDAAIDIAAFVEGLNICDANGWTISGEWSTGDGKFQTLNAMLQAGGGEPISRGAQVSVMVNSPRVATYTYTADDLIGSAEVRPLTARRERKNTIVPRYRSEAHGWEYVPAGEVTSQVYRDEDRGEPRSIEIEYVHVRDPRQAGQLAAYDLANLREGLTVSLPSKAHLMHLHPGDMISVNVPELALANQKFLIRRTTTSHQSATTTLELRSETDGKHAWALGQTANPSPSPSLSAVDPNYVPPPAPETWVITPRPPSEDGTSQPGVVIIGGVVTADVASVVVEYGLSNDGPWTMGYSGAARLEGVYELTGLEPNTNYWVSIRYIMRNGAISDRMIQGPIQTGALSAGIDQAALDEIRDDFTNLFGPVQQELEDLAAQALLDAAAAQGAIQQEIADRIAAINATSAAIAAETQGRIDEIAAERLARGEEINEVTNLVTQVRTDLTSETSTRQQQISTFQDSIAAVGEAANTYADQQIASATLNFTTTAAFQEALSGTLTSAKSYADGIKTYADQTFATTSALGSTNSATLTSAKSYADGIKTYADQTFATTTALGTGLATTLTNAKTYTDALRTDASLTFITTATLNQANANTLSAANSHSDGIKAYADQTFATSAALGTGLANTLSTSKSYTDALRSDASLTFVTTATLGQTAANTLAAANSHSDGIKAYADQTFATSSALGTANSNTLIAAKSYTDALRTDANQTFATQSALGGVNSTATIAQQTAVAANGTARALIGLETQVGGLITGIYSGNDGRIGNVRVSAHHFSVETPGNPADRVEISGTTGIKIFANGVRRIHLGLV